MERSILPSEEYLRGRDRERHRSDSSDGPIQAGKTTRVVTGDLTDLNHVTPVAKLMKTGGGMTLNVEAPTEWDRTATAFCGAVFGAVAVLAHQVYVVLFSDELIVDPFVYVITEMAVLVPGEAMLFTGAVVIRNWLSQVRLGSS